MFDKDMTIRMFKWSLLAFPIGWVGIPILGLVYNKDFDTEMLIMANSLGLGVLGWWVAMAILMVPIYLFSLAYENSEIIRMLCDGTGALIQGLAAFAVVILLIALVIAFPIFFAVIIGLLLLAAIARGVNQ